jgi:3-methylcrotonyl-CoA carboxylase alpha subunit
MRQALAQYRIVGVSNNVDFLARLVAVPSFANARLDTGLIEREHALLFPPAGDVPADVWLLAALAELLRERRLAEKKAAQSADPHSPWRALDGWRLNGRTGRRLQFRLGDTVQDVGIEVVSDAYRMTVGPHTVLARGSLGLDSELQAQLGERRLRATVVAANERRHVFFEGRAWALALVDTLHVGGAGEEVEGGLRAPMPGKVIALAVEPGTQVEKGAPLLVLEAMKMEHTISAPRKGVVKGYRYAPGDQVSDGAELLDFEGAE